MGGRLYVYLGLAWRFRGQGGASIRSLPPRHQAPKCACLPQKLQHFTVSFEIPKLSISPQRLFPTGPFPRIDAIQT
jgi:hypothetical protein